MTFNTELWNTQTPGAGGYEIERSLRFNSSDSAYLSKNFGSVGNRKTWTWSGWVKRSALTNNARLFCAQIDGSNRVEFMLNNETDNFMRVELLSSSSNGDFVTNQLFRDVSAWYHIVLAVDTTQATNTNRVKIYVNGAQITSFSTATYPNQNIDYAVNNNVEHNIGRSIGFARHFSGYMTDIHFIDGQALDPTSFGEPDDNGVWQPIEFTANGPNNGTTWSSNLTTNAGINFDGSFPVTNAFDNSTTTKCVTANNANGTTTGTSYIQFNSPNAFTGNLKVVCENGNAVYDVSGGGSTLLATNTSGSDNFLLDCGTVTGITSIRVLMAGGSRPGIGAIFINGVMLVDGVGQYGTNGFHLPFSDNSSAAALGYDAAGSNDWTVNNITATAINYSNTATETSTSGYTPSNDPNYYLPNLFDGNTGTYYTIAVAGTNNVTATFSPKLPSGTTIELYGWKNSSNTTGVVEVNGTDVSSLIDANYPGSWADVSSAASGGIQTITLYRQDGVKNPALTGVRVDGTVLVPVNPADIDSLVDSPTNGSQEDTGVGNEVVGNYATLNPLNNNGITLSNGNLTASKNSLAAWSGATATIGMSSGKWYWEYVFNTQNYSYVGIAKAGWDKTYLGSDANSWGYYSPDGKLWTSGAGSVYGASWTSGDVIGVAFDATNGTLVFYKNGTSQGTAATGLTAGPYFPGISLIGTITGDVNFGQRPFAYTAPSGFKALCTTNLAEPTIADGSTAFEVITYQGNGTTQTLPNTDPTTSPQDPLKFSPGLLWFKRRDVAASHALNDAVRGVTKSLASNGTEAEYTSTANTDLVSINSDGFTVGPTDVWNSYNVSGGSTLAWTWDAGSSNTTIAAGGLNSSLYDQSQTWSNSLTSSNGFWSGQGATKAFDGTGSSVTGTNNGGTLTLSLSLTIPANSTIQVRPSTQSGGYTVVVNGVSNSITGDSFHTVNYDGATTLTSITVTSAGSSSADLKGIKINGALLTDTGVTLPNVPSIASTVRANPSAGFSIVTYTGNNTNSTVGHGLGVTPEMIIVKTRTTTDGWAVFHKSLGVSNSLFLNTTSAAVNEPQWWANTSPTSTVFSVGTPSGITNGSGVNYVAYCFAPVDGYSSFGSYEAILNVNGPFVYTGFRPKWIMIKNIDDTASPSSYGWTMIDTSRYPYNASAGNLNPLYANAAYKENSYSDGNHPAGQLALDVLSNGFKLRSANYEINFGQTYIYAAFAENPFKYARAR